MYDAKKEMIGDLAKWLYEIADLDLDRSQTVAESLAVVIERSANHAAGKSASPMEPLQGMGSFDISLIVSLSVYLAETRSGS